MILSNNVLRCFCLMLILSFGAFTAADGEKDTLNFSKNGALFLERYCFSCHAGDQPAAELSLDSYTDSHSLIKDREVWDRVLDMVETTQMPPADNEQPSIEALESFIAHIEAIFEHADRTAKPDPGRVTVRRLNRVEYRNTVRDLLGVDFNPTEKFPADDVGHGFDNIGDVLSMSPLLMERYLEAAEAIVSRVIVLDPLPPSRSYRNGKTLEPLHDDVPDERYRLLDPTATEPWKSGPFTTGADNFNIAPDVEIIYHATLYAETERDTPVEAVLFIQGDELAHLTPPEKLSRLVGVDPSVDNNIKVLKAFKITARSPEKNQTIKVHITGIPNIENVGIAMLKPKEGEPDAKLQIRVLWSKGPLETRPKSHFEILACTPGISQAEQTREVLTRLLRRGYRRPPTENEIEHLAQFAESVQADGASWEASVQAAIKVILCSPKFLFRWELDARPQTPEPHPIDEFQLAARLAYFIWSSMPDDELLELAETKQLTANLEAQVKRMLADAKASELGSNFGAQWLQIQRLTTVAPDLEKFPYFTGSLRLAMQKETELFVESIFREDRSLLDLIDADYTFLNQPIASHYGIVDTQGNWRKHKNPVPGGERIRGKSFRRVKIQGTSRGGILSHASVLTVTSNPTRTSPVKRGRWVLEQILGTPPPPPPPDVPELEEEAAVVHGTTLRERLEQHRADPACANCHAKMDPIGFALENYNAIGAFRWKDGELDIDTTAVLPDGTVLQHGIVDLRRVILDRKQQFLRCLTEKLLTYALGRGLEYYDRPTVEHIVAQLETKDYRSSVLITEIVKSDPFRLRRGTAIKR